MIARPYLKGSGATMALCRSIAHTSMHVGQIVLLAKHLAGKDWMNLSVPRGRSQGLSGDYKSKGIARQ